MGKLQLIGFAGPVKSGKSTLARVAQDLLVDFEVISISDLIRAVIDSRNLEPTRDNYSSVVVEFRRQNTADYWTQLALEQAEVRGLERVIVESVRNPADGDYLLSNGALLIGVYAPESLRFQRVRDSLREGEPQSDEAIRKMLSDDFLSQGECGFDIPSTLALCHHIIDGSKSVEHNTNNLIAILSADPVRFELM